MANDYFPVGDCPKCGAPIFMLEEDTLNNGRREEDAFYNCYFLPGVTYTCRCYRFLQENQFTYIPSCWESPTDDSQKLPYETTITWKPETSV